MQRKSWILATVCLSLLGLAGCHREQSDWAKARAANDMQSYQLYLKQYPNGSFAAQAQARIARLEEQQDWQKARAADTVGAYQAFLSVHPQGNLAEEARIRIENLALAQPPGAAPAGQPAQAPAAAPASVAAVAPPATPPATAPAQRAARRAAISAQRHHAPLARHRAVFHDGVQLGAFKDGEAAALRHWRLLVGHERTLLRGLHPRVRAVTTAAGRLYRLQVEGLSAARAAAICRGLKARGQACMVLRPTRGGRH